jgi:hypothetical protein
MELLRMLFLAGILLTLSPSLSTASTGAIVPIVLVLEDNAPCRHRPRRRNHYRMSRG